MNVADSMRVASALEQRGYRSTTQPEEADLIVLNTCVVRQSAEDKAYNRLLSLRPLKKKNPKLVINLMGCMVGIRGDNRLKERFSFVDIFSPPSDPGPLLTYLSQAENREFLQTQTENRFNVMDNQYPEVELPIPLNKRGGLVSSFVPVVLGCSHACTFCIIPYRRGVERSRLPADIIREVNALVENGVKEIILLGQIVDRYGKDLSDGHSLASLLRSLVKVEGLERIRFLTSHPNWMTNDLMDTVAELDKVMPHIEVPVQAGDDEVLFNMRRRYTSKEYNKLIWQIRDTIPGVSIGTDIIVGFPGEKESQFQNTYDMLADLKLDMAHIARYSPRPGTVAKRHMVDDVPDEEKWRRFRILEELQERIATEINARYMGKSIEVLFEEKVRDRWRGRTPTNKLVFIQSDADLLGKVRGVRITWTGPWSMLGNLEDNQIS